MRAYKFISKNEIEQYNPKKPILYHGHYVVSASENTLTELGYKPLTENPKPPKQDFYKIVPKYTETEDNIINEWKYAEIIAETYEELVANCIAEKYSYVEEFAINRQRDTKPEEFQTYFDYCESCKIHARTKFQTT